MSVKFDPLTKILLTVTIVMTVVIAVVVYLVLFSAPGPRRRADAPDAPLADATAGIRCDASDLEDTSCPNDQYCNIDTCVPLPQDQVCGEGESCRECECADGLLCHQNRCVSEDRVDRTPLICEKNKRLAEAVRTLATKCAKRKKNVDEIVSSGACTTSDWQELALEDDKFDLLLSAFPNRFAVHFPSGEPRLKRRDWPSQTEREYYLAQLRPYRTALSEAKQIFVIGRASPDGDAETNHLLALRRMHLVSGLIETTMYEGIALTERGQHRPRTRTFTLPSSNPIDPGKYKATYLESPADTVALDLDPLVTWDPQSHRKMEAALKDATLLAGKSGREWKELFSAVNRVVLVIPIPCTGDEYQIPASDLSPPEAVEGAP